MTLGIFASGANDDKRNLLERRGFVVRAVGAADARSTSVATAVGADGATGRVDVAIGPIDPADLDAVRDGLARRVREHGRFSPRRMDEWLASRLRAPGVRPVAVAGRRRATARSSARVSVFDVGETGYTSTVGVRAGLARARASGPALAAGGVRGAPRPGPDAGAWSRSTPTTRRPARALRGGRHAGPRAPRPFVKPDLPDPGPRRQRLASLPPPVRRARFAECPGASGGEVSAVVVDVAGVTVISWPPRSPATGPTSAARPEPAAAGRGQAAGEEDQPAKPGKPPSRAARGGPDPARRPRHRRAGARRARPRPPLRPRPRHRPDRSGRSGARRRAHRPARQRRVPRPARAASRSPCSCWWRRPETRPRPRPCASASASALVVLAAAGLMHVSAARRRSPDPVDALRDAGGYLGAASAPRSPRDSAPSARRWCSSRCSASAAARPGTSVRTVLAAVGSGCARSRVGVDALDLPASGSSTTMSDPTATTSRSRRGARCRRDARPSSRSPTASTLDADADRGRRRGRRSRRGRSRRGSLVDERRLDDEVEPSRSTAQVADEPVDIAGARGRPRARWRSTSPPTATATGRCPPRDLLKRSAAKEVDQRVVEQGGEVLAGDAARLRRRRPPHRHDRRPDGHPLRARARAGREGEPGHRAQPRHRLRDGEPRRAHPRPDPGAQRDRRRGPEQAAPARDARRHPRRRPRPTQATHPLEVGLGRDIAGRSHMLNLADDAAPPHRRPDRRRASRAASTASSRRSSCAARPSRCA